MTPPPPLPPPASPPPIPATARLEPLTVAPGFFQALRGVWSLTWRTNTTSRSLLTSLACLLALPVLVYISANAFRSLPLSTPGRDTRRLAGQLNRHNVGLSQEARTNVAAIFVQEYERARQGWQPPATNAPSEEITGSQIQALNRWNRRLTSRVEPVLTPDQVSRFEDFQTRLLHEKMEIVNRQHWNASDAFYNMLIDFYFFLVLPLVCARSSGAVFRDELQAETLGFLLTRPVSRALLVTVKYISQTAWLFLLLLAQTLLFFAAGALRDVPHLPSVLPLFFAAQCLAVPAWSALGLFLGLVTNRYIALALIYGFVVELGIGRIPTNINTLSLMRHLKDLLANNPTLAALFDPPATPATWAPIAALLIGVAVFLTASVLLFTFREYHLNAEMQK